MIARIDPKPEVPPLIEPVAPKRGGATHQAFTEGLAGPVRNLEPGNRPADWIESDEDADADTDKHQAERTPQVSDEVSNAPPEELERPLRYKVQFTASQEYVDLLNEALDLLGQKKKVSNLPEVQLVAMRGLVERLRKQRDAARTAPAREGKEQVTAPARRARAAAAPREERPRKSRGRYVPAPVRRAVWGRDEARCAYVDK